MRANRGRWQEDAIEYHLCNVHGWWRVDKWRSLVVDLSRHASKEALRPMFFRQILKRHVSELLAEVECCSGLPDGQQLVKGLRSVSAFLSGRELRWEAFAKKGRSLIGVPGHPSPVALVSLGQLMALGPAINVFFEYAEAPPAPGFCAMCWRFVLSGEKYCRTHRVPAGGAGGAGGQTRQAHDGYWFGRKLSPLFNEHIRRLSSQARNEKLRSQWKEVVEVAQVVSWLERYRPLVWQFVVGRVGRPEEDSVLLALVQTLDDHSLEVGDQRGKRAHFHRLLLNDRKAVFDLLLRAEARLGAAAERRASWGGSRAGAGRPAKVAASALQI